MKKQLASIVSKLLAFNATRKRNTRNDTLAEIGMNPFISFSESGSEQISREDARAMLSSGHILVPNVSGFYHGILRRWLEKFGLGSKCLLISETKAVAAVFAKHYPATEFISTDFYLDLQPDPKCHVVWDLCSQTPPAELRGFHSIVCQATLEHVLDPVQVLRNLSAILAEGGHLFIQTHTPAYTYHPYPRDYLRYQPDWFQDVGKHLHSLTLTQLLCIDGHAFAVYRRPMRKG
jgi:hypothetical protein